MRNHALIGTTLLFGALLVACGGGGGGTGGSTSTTTGNGGQSSTIISGSTNTGGSGSTTTSLGGGGTGTTGSTTTSSSTTSSMTGSTTTGSGTGGSTPGADHILISEVGVAPDGGEFIEIWNPTGAAVDLSNYYLSDNGTYHGIAAGMPFNPPLATPGTDFLVQFPAGTMLPADGVIVIAAHAAFETQFSKCPDYILSSTALTCTNGTAKAMVIPTNGAIGAMAGLSNQREMVILFRWMPGTTKVEDVDYVTWGGMVDAETRVDKTAVTGYKPDTAPNSQTPAPTPMAGQSIERCGPTLEAGEKTTGGNGLTGHDETSEALDTTFKVQTTPTPGVKNTCL